MLVQKLPLGDFEISVYRKETNAGVDLHFDSNHPACHKRSCIKAFFGRVDTHCSSEGARRQERTYPYMLFNDNGYPLNFIKRTLRQRPLPTRENTTAEIPKTTWRPLPYVQGVSELKARHLRPYNLNIVHKPTESLRKTLVHVEDPLPTQRRRNVVYNILCSDCPIAYVGQTAHQFATRVKEHQSAVRRQNETSLLALHCLTTGHAFDWTRASTVGNGTTKRTLEFSEAWKTTPTCVNQCTTINPCYKALRAYWKHKRTLSKAVGRTPSTPSCFSFHD